MTFILQQFANLGRLTGAKQPALIHNSHLGCQRKSLLQAVLGEDDSCTEFTVDFTECGQKIRCRDRVKLAGRLVQYQNTGLHGHHRGQIKQLFLPARQLGDVFVKPRLNAKKRCHLRHPAAYRQRIIAKALQAESQLMPHLIRHDLILRRLLHKADFLALRPLIQLIQRHTLKQNLTAAAAVRRQYRL